MQGTLNVYSMNQNAKRSTENIGIINVDDLFDATKREAFAEEIETFTRELITLSTNTYDGAMVGIGVKIPLIEEG